MKTKPKKMQDAYVKTCKKIEAVCPTWTREAWEKFVATGPQEAVRVIWPILFLKFGSAVVGKMPDAVRLFNPTTKDIKAIRPHLLALGFSQQFARIYSTPAEEHKDLVNASRSKYAVVETGPSESRTYCVHLPAMGRAFA